MSRASRVEIDPSAIAHNLAWLTNRAGGARVLAVVKADGYGHGAVVAAEAAIAAGVDGLCVALVQEGVELRRAGIEVPVLVLSEQPLEQVGELVAHGLIATAYSTRYVDALADEARRHELSGQEVHLKIDTGMNRVGCRPSDATELAGRILARSPHLMLGGVFTHLATADDADASETEGQLDRFEAALSQLRRSGIDPGLVHAANSAATIAHPRSRFDLVRVGIAMYGIAPDSSMTNECSALRPALSLRSRVSYVKQVVAGDGVSYGLRHRFDRPTTVATVPIGYADGVPRRSWHDGAEVLIRGIRRPIVGVVTMDQLMVDCGDDTVDVDDEVVLIGRQGDDEITVNDWATLTGTIGYEIVCGLSRRLPRFVIS